MEQCANCGKALRRLHRSFFQQLRYTAVFRCPHCGTEECAPQPYQFHFGPNVQCPRCGSTRVSARARRDRIDPMYWGFLTILELILGRGKLYHCYFCRIQFYDRRTIAPNPVPNA